MLGSISKSITTLVVAVGALLNTNLNPVFNEVNIDYSGKKLTCSAKLDNCYNEDLNKIFTSGKEIRIDYTIEIISKNKSVIKEKTFYHEFYYDLIDENFIIFLSENERYKVYKNISDLKNHLASIESIVVTEETKLIEEDYFYIKITAEIKPIYLQSTKKQFDLLKYWNDKPAVFSSNKLRLKEITR